MFIARSDFDLLTFSGMLIGICLVIGSACVVNNYLDRNLDAKMERTSKRALVVGKISKTNALIYAATLGIVGFASLIIFTNWLTVFIGFIGYIDYIVIYGLAKRYTNFGTGLGSISGSAALVAGYTTYTNHFGKAALILFFIMVFWQMAHFHSIALYRLKDYKAAGLPVLPVQKGEAYTRLLIRIYIICFLISALLLGAFSETSDSYLIVMTLISLYWIYKSLDNKLEHSLWAKQMFKLSLVVLLVFSALLCLNFVLP